MGSASPDTSIFGHYFPRHRPSSQCQLTYGAISAFRGHFSYNYRLNCLIWSVLTRGHGKTHLVCLLLHWASCPHWKFPVRKGEPKWHFAKWYLVRGVSPQHSLWLLCFYLESRFSSKCSWLYKRCQCGQFFEGSFKIRLAAVEAFFTANVFKVRKMHSLPYRLTFKVLLYLKVSWELGLNLRWLWLPRLRKLLGRQGLVSIKFTASEALEILALSWWLNLGDHTTCLLPCYYSSVCGTERGWDSIMIAKWGLRRNLVPDGNERCRSASRLVEYIKFRESESWGQTSGNAKKPGRWQKLRSKWSVYLRRTCLVAGNTENGSLSLPHFFRR